MNILVTDGDSRAALAITRSLGSKGYHVVVGAESESSLASSSRYCREGFAYPSPREEPEAFVECLLEAVEINHIDVLMPVTDVSLFLISKNRDRFPDSCKIPIAGDDAIRAAADKNHILKLAESVGMPAPRSQVIQSKDEADKILERFELSYPVVLKPVRSRVRLGDKWLYTAVDYARNREELREKLLAQVAGAYPVILQERVTGVGSGAFYCFDHGECVAKFAHARIREKPPSGGVSVVRESKAVDRIADEYSQKLLKALGWHGVAMVELKVDSESGRAYIMEINGRFWGSLQLAIDAGVDFPAILLSLALERPLPASADYRTGVKSRWFWGDIDLLLMYLFKKREALKLPKGHPGKLRAILSILLPSSRGQRFEILRISDIGPWFYETRMWIQSNILNRSP